MQTSAAENINNSFFQGVYKEVWKKLMHPALSVAESEFIIDVAALKQGDHVLDLMCGHGRHAVELAKKGLRVTAIDNSEYYIDSIKKEASESGLKINAFAEDVLTTEIFGQYKAAICMGNSFAFFKKEDALEILKKVSNSLEDEGIFIINSWMIAEIAIRHFEERIWQQVDEYKYLIHNQYLFYPTRILSEHTIITNDQTVEVIEGVDYILSLSEMDELFSLAGLKTIGLYSTPRKKKFTLGDRSIYIVAQKKLS